jgi:predicted nucleic acid-binding protein
MNGSFARFVDTGYWIASVDRSDLYHERAVALARRLTGPLVMTEAILTEVGNALAALRWRAACVTLLRRIRSNPAIEIVSVTEAVFSIERCNSTPPGRTRSGA